jgi:GNAT superfamily N-acetyltransferase
MRHGPVLDGLTVEPAGISNMDTAVKVFARAMGREQAHIEEHLRGFSLKLAEAGLGHFFIARHRDTPIGYGGLVGYQRVGWIGFMGTDPAFQGRGVGAAIMENIMALAAHMRLTTIKLDATNIGRKLYSKFGFADEFPAMMGEIRSRCSRGKPKDPPIGAVKMADDLPEWCSVLDRRAFGDDRSALIRTALRHGAKLLLVGERGFGLIEGKKLGPLVAGDPETAVDILRWASDLGARLAYVPRHADLPKQFIACLKFPRQHGPIRCCTRMIWGLPVRQELGLVYADYSAATG